MAQYLAGLALGLALIMPIGAQNVFIVNQGLAVGIPRALIAAAVTGTCDSILILVGWKGMATVLEHSTMTRAILLLAGVAFLLWLGMRALTAAGEHHDDQLVGTRVRIV
jgi:L-lysine exporter family protein LysE/ArgO